MGLKIGSDITVDLKIGEETATFTLRQPTNEELNKFLGARYTVGGRGKQVADHSTAARGDLFDVLVTKITGVEDGGGAPVEVNRKALIPLTWKERVIFQAFEDVEVDVKN
jgi:hypothetical protein